MVCFRGAPACVVPCRPSISNILLYSSRNLSPGPANAVSLPSPFLFSLFSAPKDSPVLSCRAHTAAAPTLREICSGSVPEHILQRAEEIGYVVPTAVQHQSLPLLLSGRDCILHAQTGSGKTLAYLLLVFSALDFNRSAVQALIVVPTRELGMQVTKVARGLATMPKGCEGTRTCTVMALLDGGMLKRHRSWLKVDFMFNSSKQVHLLRKLLTSYSAISSRQTILASATIPQHNRFVHDCVQQKWTKNDVVHVHVNPVEPMPSNLCHKFVICSKKERLRTLLYLLQKDMPKSGIVFVGEQSEKSKKLGQPPSTTLIIEFLRASYMGCLEVILLEEEMNFNARATSFSELRERGCLLVSTDIASRGFDLPQTTHIYNFDLPRSAVDYLHRAGRTGRIPFSKDKCSVTSLITKEERFVLQRFENELMFQSEELVLESLTN
ncbi:DEAD-box ATP-dependent RNA helicase 58, chloroplastic isoform X2 [Elaeis guineensis]|uniref:RNA helicase n=1 Tax=Elaeis guineensis var. tenera TaxID=51953 RepID=A0A8N4IFL5_ELAGV|nr:DEAD-box ATP-dependent RNA helicase 58, chloroplastic isoform X2 [Elaeis guineensis]